jgi:hypothetical protein
MEDSVMKKVVWFVIFLPAILAAGGLVFGDSERFGKLGEGDEGEHGWWNEARLDVAPVQNELYQRECGSCHFAYQPGLLPARSWQKMMANLEDHFGDNAELGQADQQAILAYLTANAADTSNFKRSTRIAGSLHDSEVPLRISDTVYFKRKHHEIPPRFVVGNKQVGSFSNCNACHKRAERGSYNEHEVSIPGVGRWDD